MSLLISHEHNDAITQVSDALVHPHRGSASFSKTPRQDQSDAGGFQLFLNSLAEAPSPPLFTSPRLQTSPPIATLRTLKMIH